MTKRHSVAVLRAAGLQQREVAELTGVSERSVRRIEVEPVIESLDDAVERARRSIWPAPVSRDGALPQAVQAAREDTREAVCGKSARTV
ncbi:MAG: helix-turn-helix domain-containing protein [Myxococcota bacterium]